LSKIKHPASKKRKSLQKDHRVLVDEGNKSFRGVWRKKKRRAAKQERRSAELKLRHAEPEDAASPKRAIAKRLKKTGAVTLAKALEIKKRRPGLRFSRLSYDRRRSNKISP
jgi:NADH:ubiquinone oxidoreductase subunit D